MSETEARLLFKKHWGDFRPKAPWHIRLVRFHDFMEIRRWVRLKSGVMLLKFHNFHNSGLLHLMRSFNALFCITLHFINNHEKCIYKLR